MSEERPETETIRLPVIDRDVPRVGVGTVTFGGHWGPMEEREAIAAVRAAWDSGLTFFDTADCYGLGRAEELLSEALGPHRHEAMISTKFGVRWDATRRTWKDIRPSYMREALEASLRRLRLERIPFYYVHWPDGVTPIAEVIGELLRCQEEGKIGGIALSNPSLDDLLTASKLTQLVAVQFQYSLVNREVAAELLPACIRARVPVITWGSLAQGVLSGKYAAGARFAEGDRRNRDANFAGEKFTSNLRMAERLAIVAQRLGRTSIQTAIRWLLDTEGVAAVLAGPKNSEQTLEYWGALGWHLPQPEYDELARLDE